jgi:hypothetical protein
MHEYILERLEEDSDAVLCKDEYKQFWLPKSRCRILQQDHPWERKKPDIILIRIPDDIADNYGLY